MASTESSVMLNQYVIMTDLPNFCRQGIHYYIGVLSDQEVTARAFNISLPCRRGIDSVWHLSITWI